MTLLDFEIIIVPRVSAKPSLGCQPMFGLAEDSRTTDFRLGFRLDNYEHVQRLVDLATKVALRAHGKAAYNLFL